MATHRFSLDNSRPTRLFHCPQCGKRRFKRYVDHETNAYLPEQVGRCNREINCGYHFSPKMFFAGQPDFFGVNPSKSASIKINPPENPVIDFHSPELVRASMQKFHCFFGKFICQNRG